MRAEIRDKNHAKTENTANKEQGKIPKNEEKHLRFKRITGVWQGMRDSNPRKRSQSPVCYRYTNPLTELLSEAHDYYSDLF